MLTSGARRGPGGGLKPAGTRMCAIEPLRADAPRPSQKPSGRWPARRGIAGRNETRALEL